MEHPETPLTSELIAEKVVVEPGATVTWMPEFSSWATVPEATSGPAQPGSA
ncbi:MAG: hypothetical protein H0X42_04005 [Solirubrobacterales bacterium]|nr:hypothetical protein [Solirubrobacterales bacterium]